ncbi:MAG: hypothetical protein RI544_03540 [Haloquadratum sp.]|jgi:hypothetical protein|nr:hypothetical protein [Haloferacaceae archaeon]MDR9445213.1 hypothetical protein [Haloquadratum sp.]
MVASGVLLNTVGMSLLAGAMLGARHAVEADHIAAVSSMIRPDTSASVLGLWWAIGHMVPIAVGGLLAVSVGLIMPPWVAATAESVVGLMLIVLGLIGILPCVGVRLRGRSHALTHRDSFAVGIIHGLAGSGAMIVILTASVRELPMAAVFLGGVGIGSVATMVLLAGAWGRLRRRMAAVQSVVALVSVALGVGIILRLV